MTDQDNNPNLQALLQAKDSLKKLPILGPAMWLYARDERRKYTFIAEQDWLLIPPIVLDQAKIYTRDEIPWAFATWAFVSDEVDARLRSSIPRIAPHEWQSGKHAWLIDMVAPFGDYETLVAEAHQSVFNGASFSALQTIANGSISVKDYPAKTK